ncbi:ATP-binding protein [Streptomyces sp. MS2.AVA.5]|uniref:ATP-binding protein n=1 Tax=Streptomyces achmelvichensis TaxID=3134111 RepID=A0ACC6PKY3_9ACTN
MKGRSLFAKWLTIAEERLRRLYLEHEKYGTDEAPQLDPVEHCMPEAAELQRLAAGGDPLAHLVIEFGLTEQEVDLLVTCLLPDLNPLCGAAFRALSGLAGSRPTTALVLAVHGINVPDAIARGLFREGARLAATGLVAHENHEAAFPDRIPYVPDRVVGFLCGDRAGICGSGLWLHLLPEGQTDPDSDAVRRLTNVLSADAHRTLYLRQGIGGEALPTARAALAATGRVALVLDPDALATADLAHGQLAQSIALESRLLGAGVLVPVPDPDSTAPEEVEALRRVVARLDVESVPLLLYGGQEWATCTWDMPLVTETDVRPEGTPAAGERLSPLAETAVERVHRSAALRAVPVPMQDVRAVARDRAARGLGRLARRVSPQVDWSDLVLPAPVHARLEMLVARVRLRDMVLDGLHLRRGGGRGRGTAALFAGESGTGKTLAAEVVAGELGLDLYIVSLSSVISKYIGETEKNLERIFTAAESLAAVVLFDEADSMFSKRSEVRGANDRHANMQSGYLLQRLESFNGLAVLTTNLRSNIDTAFTRRFDEVVEFDRPGPQVRACLWRTVLGPGTLVDAPLDALARAYDLAGGSIRASVETAAFAAASQNREMTLSDLLDGIESEYRKLGRLFDSFSEIGT